MLNHLRTFFMVFSKIDEFLRKPHVWGMNGFMIVSSSILMFGVIGMQLDKLFETDLFIKPTTFLFGSLIYCILPYLFYKEEKIKKYIIWGEKESIEEITKKFNSKAYFVFVLFFSYFLIIPILGVPLMFQIFKIDILVEIIQKNLIIIVYILLSFTSILWFSYHIISKIVELQKIKVKVALYTAIGSTLAILQIKEFEQFSVVVSCLMVSYVWIQYIIELKSEEEMGNQ